MGRKGSGGKLKNTWELVKETFKSFSQRDPFRNAAVIAYFAIFSLPGLLVIVINVAGYFMDREELVGTVTGQVTELIGPKVAEDIDRIISKAGESGNTTIANIVSIATLIFGATGIFFHVQKTLNIMWGVEAEPERKFLKVLRDRLFSFGMILGIGFLLVISLLLSSLLASFNTWISSNLFPEAGLLFQLLDLALSLAVITVVFAAMYRFLPDARLAWRDVFVGALVTTFLFLLAKYALSFYFSQAEPGSVYGAAGSIVLVMLWVTYTGIILLLGAEFTLTYAKRKGSKIELPEHASWRDGDPKEKERRVE